MGSFLWEDNRFVYIDQCGKRVLLDCGDFLANKSRIPMHKLPGQDPMRTLPEWISASIDKMRQENETKVLAAALIDTLLADRMIRSSQPFCILEYGCGDGLLSSQLAGLMGAFNEESSLVCAYDAIEMGWLERISKVEKLPKISYLAGDFGNLQLRQKYFDIVVVNGSVDYDEPLEILRDTLELVAEEGEILCYVDHTPLLESTFKLFFEEREEYEISPVEKILIARAKDRCWEIDKGEDLGTQIRQHLRAAEELLMDKKGKRTEIVEMIESLRQDGKKAAQQGMVGLKKQILEQKERMITYLIEIER